MIFFGPQLSGAAEVERSSMSATGGDHQGWKK